MGIFSKIEESLQREENPEINYDVGVDPYEVDISAEIPPTRFLVLDSFGAGTLPLGDITVVSSKSKVGKSTFVSILEGATLGGCKNFGLNSGIEEAKILHFDTEQALSTCAHIIKRVHRFLYWDFSLNYKRFRFFSLRQMKKKERLPYIEEKIFSYSPDLVVVDGIADLCEDFQNNVESDKLSKKLLSLASANNCAICVVLHENKGKEDKGMKGHLGTLLLQDGASIFHLERKGEERRAIETEGRNKPFSDISFSLDDFGFPFPLDVHQQEKKLDSKDILLRNNMLAVFRDSETLRYCEIVKKYLEITGSSSRTAKRAIEKGLENGVISQSETGSYNLVTTL